MSSIDEAVNSRLAMSLSSPYPCSANASMQFIGTTGDIHAIMLLEIHDGLLIGIMIPPKSSLDLW